MPPRQQQPPPQESTGLPDQQLAEAAAAMGLSPAEVAAALAGGGAAADPYAIYGYSEISQMLTDRVGVRQQQRHRPGPPLGQGNERARVFTGQQLITATVGNVLKKFYQLEPSVLRRMQALLYAGGFFGEVDVTDVAWGVADEASFSAWSQAVARTARLNAAGKEVTYDQVIGEAAWAAGLDPEALGMALDSDDDTLEALLGGMTGEGRVLDVILSDPNGLRSTMDRVSSSVLGRKANAAEQRMFTSLIHNLQREGQIARQTAEPQTVDVGSDPAAMLGLDGGIPTPGDVVTEYAPPDEAATAEAALRAQNPAEAGAHDIAMQFASFLEMLPAPVNVPRVTI